VAVSYRPRSLSGHVARATGEIPVVDDLAPAIIAETTADIPELSVGEAVMQLEISNLPFVLFRNRTGSGFNLVYRRHDGHIGWIEPGRAG